MLVSVNEIFYSIQGESTHTGRPCIFIRLTGCNLRCAWCDTSYAYAGGKLIPIPEILEKIREFPCRLVEITGGEPLLQECTARLVSSLLDLGYEVLLETNGSQDIRSVNVRAKIIMDIKCPSSGMMPSNKWENIPFLKPSDEIKFVIGSLDDYAWAREKITVLKLVDRCPVLMSPVFGKIPPALLAKWILADGLPVRMQLQLHRYIWPEIDRGV